jgi:hypothetical protein
MAHAAYKKKTNLERTRRKIIALGLCPLASSPYKAGFLLQRVLQKQIER